MKLFVKMRFLASLSDFIYIYHSRFPSRTEFRVMLLDILYKSVVLCYMYTDGLYTQALNYTKRSIPYRKLNENSD